MKLIPLEGKENSNLYRHPVTGIIYLKMYRANKGQIEKSTKTTVAKVARERKDQILQKWLGLVPKHRILKLAREAWEDMVRTKDDKAPGTIASINYAWKNLEPFIGDCVPEEITAQLWEDYIERKRSELPGRKFFNEWKWLNMFTGYLRDNALIERRPKLRNPDPKHSEAGKVFSPQEINGLLANAGPDLHLQILMGYTMGMRVGEILNLTWERIDLKGKTIHLRAQDTKIRRARTFRISSTVLRVLEDRGPKKGPLFPSPTDPSRPVGKGGNKTSWTNCRRDAKVRGRFHDLRHTFLTNAFKAGKGKIDSLLICAYAGLSIEQAQETYLHFTADDTAVVSCLVSSGKNRGNR